MNGVLWIISYTATGGTDLLQYILEARNSPCVITLESL